jgi:hypothetical protein
LLDPIYLPPLIIKQNNLLISIDLLPSPKTGAALVSNSILIIKLIINMYFPAESDEELELERDLDQLMKELRVQEDLFWRVIECISKITRADEGENYIFIHEDIRKYRCVIEEARQEA